MKIDGIGCIKKLIFIPLHPIVLNLLKVNNDGFPNLIEAKGHTYKPYKQGNNHIFE
ncbi:hypothetical protein [Chryseobacterium sp.]|uniref:hypothetical protein n=1 Tax=Chryseobacterium sp. TaxID=1871047 RepID=UPI0025C6D3B6|nr:hypothetical protein [Chryseobacterium sp.]